ncbi:MAG TPA: DUF1697 domain-containing protein [Jiangellaceae bacterium]
MPSYAALLRGIGPSNPNMRNEKLRGVFERLGFDDVASVISSGNLVFRSDDTDVPTLETSIEEALRTDLGINSTTLLRSADELEAMIAADPFGDLEHGRASYLTATFRKDRGAMPEPPEFAPGSGARIVGTDDARSAIYIVTDTTSTSTPDVMALLEKTFGKAITTRTWKTVQRIATKMPPQ